MRRANGAAPAPRVPRRTRRGSRSGGGVRTSSRELSACVSDSLSRACVLILLERGGERATSNRGLCASLSLSRFCGTCILASLFRDLSRTQPFSRKKSERERERPFRGALLCSGKSGGRSRRSRRTMGPTTTAPFSWSYHQDQKTEFFFRSLPARARLVFV